MRFEVKLGNEIIGFSELEGGDPPMGVRSVRANSRLHFNPALLALNARPKIMAGAANPHYF